MQQADIPVVNKGSRSKHVLSMTLVILGLFLMTFGILYANSPKNKLIGRWKKDDRNRPWSQDDGSTRFIAFSASGKVEFISKRNGSEGVYDEGKWVVTGKKLIISACDEYVEAEYNKKAWISRYGSYWHIKGSKLYIDGLGQYYLDGENMRMISRYWLFAASCILEIFFVIFMFRSTSKRKKKQVA